MDTAGTRNISAVVNAHTASTRTSLAISAAMISVLAA